MLKDIVFLKNCPCCQKKNLFFKKKKKKNYRIFGIDGSDIISRFKCSNCLELIIYVDNENRKNSLLWVKFEEEVYDLYEKRELLLKEKVDDVNIKIELKKIEDFIKEKKHNMLAGLFVKIRKMSA